MFIVPAHEICLHFANDTHLLQAFGTASCRTQVLRSLQNANKIDIIGKMRSSN